MNYSEENKAEPQNLPKPTYWPFLTALGIVILLWGILTNIVVSAIGFLLMVISLGGWLSDLYREIKSE